MSGGKPPRGNPAPPANRDPAEEPGNEHPQEPDAGPWDKAPVEDRPNVGTVTPEDYPKDDAADAGSGGASSSGGGRPDYGSPKRR